MYYVSTFLYKQCARASAMSGNAYSGGRCAYAPKDARASKCVEILIESNEQVHYIRGNISVSSKQLVCVVFSFGKTVLFLYNLNQVSYWLTDEVNVYLKVEI